MRTSQGHIDEGPEGLEQKVNLLDYELADFGRDAWIRPALTIKLVNESIGIRLEVQVLETISKLANFGDSPPLDAVVPVDVFMK